MIIIIIKVDVFAENHKGLLAVELDLNSDLWTRPLAPRDAVPGLWYSFTVGEFGVQQDTSYATRR